MVPPRDRRTPRAAREAPVSGTERARRSSLGTDEGVAGADADPVVVDVVAPSALPTLLVVVSPWLTTLVAWMHITPSDIEETTEALLNASRALVAVAARSLADVDEVTLPQFRALVVLSRLAAVTVGDLAGTLDVHPSTATRLCDRLERKRLVRRHPGVSPDRRETTVSLTAQGRRLVGRVTNRRRRDLAAIASAMAPEDRRHAIGGLTSFARAAGELPELDPFGWTGSPHDTAPASHG